MTEKVLFDVLRVDGLIYSNELPFRTISIKRKVFSVAQSSSKLLKQFQAFTTKGKSSLLNDLIV